MGWCWYFEIISRLWIRLSIIVPQISRLIPSSVFSGPVAGILSQEIITETVGITRSVLPNRIRLREIRDWPNGVKLLRAYPNNNLPRFVILSAAKNLYPSKVLDASLRSAWQVSNGYSDRPLVRIGRYSIPYISMTNDETMFWKFEPLNFGFV